MYELRILSGLHRGATLPLDDSPLLLGACDDADVVMVDTGIEESHATLSPSESGWLLCSEGGEIRNAESNQPQSVIDLVEGDFFRLGSVWLTVVAPDARWANPPAEPVEEQFDTKMAMDEDTAAESESSEEVAAAQTVAAEAVAAVQYSEPIRVPAPPLPMAVRQKKFDKRILALGSFAALAVVSVAAYAMSSPSGTQKNDAEAEMRAEMGLNPVASSVKERSNKEKKNAEAGDRETSKNLGVLKPEELRSAFRKRLANAELLKRFDLTLNDTEWVMRASLDDEEAARFERVLKSFIAEHHIVFPIDAKIGTPETMLPFKIRSVISGANASIVTQDGDRLYIGDEYRGERLVAIDDRRVTFAGKRKIVVNW